MSGMLGQFLTESNDSASTSKLPAAYIEAVNTARFVKGFGIAALIFSIVLFLGINILGAAVGLGIGLFILRYDNQTFYRVLGIVVIVVAIILPINSLSPAILSAAVLWRGIQTLRVLAKLGQEDEDWAITKKRALIGTIASGFGLGISLLFMLLMVIWMVFLASQSM